MWVTLCLKFVPCSKQSRSFLWIGRFITRNFTKYDWLVDDYIIEQCNSKGYNKCTRSQQTFNKQYNIIISNCSNSTSTGIESGSVINQALYRSLSLSGSNLLSLSLVLCFIVFFLSLVFSLARTLSLLCLPLSFSGVENRQGALVVS